MSTATVHRWSEIEPEQLNPLLTRQFITGSQAMLSRIVLTKGCAVPRHAHPNEQLAFVLQGSLRFDLDDGTTHIVNSGEVLVIPGNVPHSAVALEDTINFDIFAPPRQDWIDKDDSYLR
jgi:quercetin dioxygenase-like cupin family protein